MTPSFTADRKALVAAIRSVLPAVGTTRELVLNGVRLALDNGRSWVEATDLDLARMAPILADSVTQGAASAVVPARRLLTVLSLGLAGDHVTVTWPTKAGQRIALSSDLTSAWVDTYPPEEWPAAHEVTGNQLVLAADDVAAMKRVSASASSDDARPILSAVALAGGFAVATDSYRLSAARVSATPAAPVLVPARAVLVLPDTGVTLTIGADGAQWGGPMDGGWSRLVDGEFPNWSMLMPKTMGYSVVFDREGLLGAVTRAEALIGPHSGTPMVIERAAGGIRLGARDGDGDLFSETVPDSDADDDCPAVAVNPRFLVDLLRSFGSRRVRVGIQDPLKPLLITTEDGDPEAFRSLLMPVRTDWSSKVRAA
jgi:DNA polymerase III sliding clamp (beta) subunit (PCNA family)